MFRRSHALGFAVFALLASACASTEPSLGNGVALGADPGSVTTTTVKAAATTTTTPPLAEAGIAVVPAGGAPLSETPGGPPFMQIHEGVAMGFAARSGEWLEVVTTCNDPAWVRESDVLVSPQAEPGAPGPGFDIGEAVVVLDPGHGDRDWGGVGPTGLAEKHINLDIAERVSELMSAARAVDWTTGDIAAGGDVPAFGAVWLTRDRSGPNEGDYELGLAFRAEFANAAGADVFVSIHNNTVPRIDVEIPGTEVFYAVSEPGSDRLASLIYEEMLRSFERFTADWQGGELLGSRARVDPETNDDYYGILRRASMPSVIVEGVYIDQPDEEALLETEEFRQAYAEGVYRGIVRFLTTDETGGTIREPELFPDDAGTVNTSACVVPAQP